MRFDRKMLLVLGTMAFAATTGLATAASAQQSQQTPKGWNYEIRDGKRVPKNDRQTNADGSWREERKDGDCTIVREKTAGGEYRETRSC